MADRTHIPGTGDRARLPMHRVLHGLVYIVPGWGKLPNLLLDAPAAKGITIMTALVAFLVHIYYSWRIYVLRRKYAPAVVVMLLSTAQLAVAAYITAYTGVFPFAVAKVKMSHMRKTKRNNRHQRLRDDYFAFPFGVAKIKKSPLRKPWRKSESLLCEEFFKKFVMSISVNPRFRHTRTRLMMMIVLLVKARRQSKFPTTVGKIHTLMRYIVETGLITSFTAIITLSLFLGKKNTNYQYILQVTRLLFASTSLISSTICRFFSLSKVYDNALLATLNSRTVLANPTTKSGRSSDTGVGSSQSQHHSNYLWRDVELQSVGGNSVTGIQVTQTTVVDVFDHNDSVQALELKVDWCISDLKFCG
ncbi:hypothetical protein BDV98DRAFT_582892 [Pterulicium gracile]|uniref:DUF6534 domain-containing protein n=1 Tax=Pterulicium gracile TaxID=1884261 RepID=A0A5C3QH13_9AGAR|nr:hypothetical protein BDV98DRAFT_582892 [Pterula gracilis]